MEKLNRHWTAKSVSAFVHRLSFDFITQVYQKLLKSRVSKRQFAERLSVTPGRVSQVFNDPGNITLDSAVNYARVVGMKVALVAYDDNDPENNNGPINSEIFYRCWKSQGSPRELMDLNPKSTAQMVFDFYSWEQTSINEDIDCELRDLTAPTGWMIEAKTNTNRIERVQ